MNLGIAELWSLRLHDADTHLKRALELAHRIGPALSRNRLPCHLAMSASLGGLPTTAALALAERAVAISESHGWATDPIAAAAFAVGGDVLVRLGRFEEAERWLERAERVVCAWGRGGWRTLRRRSRRPGRCRRCSPASTR